MPRAPGIQRQAPAQEVVGIEIAEHEVGVGHRGLGPAQAVARGSRLRAGALRPDLEQSRLGIGPGDAAAARADGLDPDLGGVDLVAQEHRLVVLLDDPVPDDAHLERGAAHVRGQDVGQVHEPAEPGASRDPGRGTRLDGADGVTGSGFHAEDAAVGLHDQGFARKPVLPQPSPQPLDVGRYARPDAGVEHGGGGAFVLP